MYADPDKMESYGISNAALPDVIRKSNSDFAVGSSKDKDAELSIRIAGKVSDFSQFENQPIRTLADGTNIRVKDVASVVNSTKETLVINRLNRIPSIGLFVSKQTGSNPVDVSDRVKEEMAKPEADYKSIGPQFSIAQDSSEFTLAAANTVYHYFFIAILLVALVMLVFLHSLRNAFIVMLAIPTS